jgi:hypothetical protein
MRFRNFQGIFHDQEEQELLSVISESILPKSNSSLVLLLKKLSGKNGRWGRIHREELIIYGRTVYNVHIYRKLKTNFEKICKIFGHI